MAKSKKRLEALERRQRFLEQKLKTSSLLYRGRTYDEAENSALKYVIEKMKGEIKEEE